MASDAEVQTRLALPKGGMLTATSEFLNAINLGFGDYNSKTRIYRLRSETMPGLAAKMLNERDIPVQVAVGNYDFGICSSDWLQELLSRYPSSRVFKIANLEYDISSIFLACPLGSPLTAGMLTGSTANWRIISEYPAMAETAAARLRLKRYRIFPCWGSSEAYLPENADLCVLRARDPEALRRLNLKPVMKLCDSNACIIANSESLQSQDFSALLGRFSSADRLKDKPWRRPAQQTTTVSNQPAVAAPEGNIWLALADGHQQAHTAPFLQKAGIKLDGYSREDLRRRPSCSLEWVSIKVIRPQDMPQQVANGNFDLAITGRDWLLDHLAQFPSSPVCELADLGFGWVRVVAVVNGDVSADSIDGIRKIIARGGMRPLRIATEYINLADKYLRDRHIARYRVIPTWGATEVYLPEDADMLIENTETGQTLSRHNLKIIDTLFESTACLICNRLSLENLSKKRKIEQLASRLKETADRK